MGRFNEAIAEITQAQQLDPLSLIIDAGVGTTYVYARQPDKAIERLRKTLDLDRNFYFAHMYLAEAYEMKRSWKDAIAEYERAAQLDDDGLANLGHAYALSGRRDDAGKVLRQLEEAAKRRYVSPYEFAVIYAGLGDHSQAFQWLERSYQDHSPDMTNLKLDPLLDPLRSDPRFANLVRRVGL